MASMCSFVVLKPAEFIMIGILDFGFGNVASVANMLSKLGVPPVVIDSRAAMAKADSFILPGVGSFDGCMRLIRKDAQLLDELEKRVLEEQAPFLGICIGMQVLFDGSDEGIADGLGWISGRVKRFSFLDGAVKIPHMGWTQVEAIKENAGLISADAPSRFYFVHSYYCECSDVTHRSGLAGYGGREFTAAVNRENIYGVQFHPEKSHRFGFELLSKFSRLTNG